MILEKIKQICVVGNSGNLIGSQLGETIDKQEIVARFNRGWPGKFKEPTRKDMGVKVDIWIRNISHGNFVPSDKSIKAFFTTPDPRILAEARKQRSEVYPLYRTGKFVRELQKIDYRTKEASLGFAFVLLCLKYKIPEINICGFTTNENYDPNGRASFFIGGTYKEIVQSPYVHDWETERNFLSQLITEKKINYLEIDTPHE